jgi:PKD repeat protein
VSLRVANGGGNDTELKSDYITVTVPPATGPIAEFSGTPLTGLEQVTTAFQFVDLRGGSVTYTNWEWDFTSNGSFDDTGESVSHTYATPGSYDVTLRVTDGTGATSVLTKVGYIVVYDQTCTVPDFANVRKNDAQDLWSDARFTTQVQHQPGNGNYLIGYQSIVGGVIDPPPAGCGSVITVGP